MKSLKFKFFCMSFLTASLSAQAQQPGAFVEEAAPSEGLVFTYDLGASVGSDQGRNYTEIHLGLNTYFNSAFAWRNAAFYRTFSDQKSLYGLDSSARFELDSPMGDVGRFNAFGGPGYRFVSEGEHLPFVEGGIKLSLGGLTIGGGAKMFLKQLVRSTDENETQYFLILSSSGRI